MHGVSFKKRAPRAIKEIRAFAVKAMVCCFIFPEIWVSSPHRIQFQHSYISAPLPPLSLSLPSPSPSLSPPKLTIPLLSQGTRDVRLDPQLNKKVWESGIKGVPFRLRVRISRKRNDEEGAKEKLYSYVQAVNVKNPKGLTTVVVEDS